MKWYNKIFTAFLLLTAISGFAVDKGIVYTENEKIEKAFKVRPDSYMEIENKYGDIEIKTWNKDSVKIMVEMIFESDDYNDLQEMKDLFDIKFENNSNFILAKTEWSDNVGFFKKGFMEISTTLGANKKLEINYTVYVPENLELQIDNKFGNVFMSDYKGSLKVELSYGDFRARTLSNLKTLNVSYGKVKVKDIKTGRIELNSVKSAIIENMDDVIIKSSSSEIEVEVANKVNLDSRHDEIVFEIVNELSGDFTLSDLEVDRIRIKMGTNSKYGSIRIKEIEPGSQMINLNGNKTDFRIGFSSFFNGQVDVTVSKEVDFIYTDKFDLESRGVDSKGMWNGKGKVGVQGTTKVLIYASNGFVELEE